MKVVTVMNFKQTPDQMRDGVITEAPGQITDFQGRFITRGILKLEEVISFSFMRDNELTPCFCNS